MASAIGVTVSDLVSLLDSALFRVLSEPARISIMKELAVSGRQDISAIARRLPQDRSVISRHLSLMEESGLIIGEREGRHTYYRLNGAAILTRLESMAAEMRTYLERCCPESLDEAGEEAYSLES